MIMSTTASKKVPILQELISIYEMRVSLIGAMVANTYRTLDEFKTQRIQINTDISEILAKQKSLRHKDFYSFMKDIDDNYRLKEQAIKDHINSFFDDHKKASQIISEKLNQENIVDAASFREFLSSYQREQEVQLKNVEILLKEFQIEYQHFLKSLCKAIESGELMNIKRLKDTLKNNK